MKFNLFDAMILVVLAFGLWRGYLAGLIKEVSQLLGVFIGFAIALQLMKPTAVFLQTFVNVVDLPLEGLALVSFVLVFLVVYFVVFLLSRLLERVADGARLGPINKLFGSIAGVAKSALMLSILLVLLGQIGIPGKETRSASYLYGSIEKIGPQAMEVFSRSVPTATKMTHKVGERFWEKSKEGAEAETETPADPGTLGKRLED